MKDKEMPKEQIELKIEKESYTVKFPNNRQFLSIESEKNRLSGGGYDQFSYNRGDQSGFLAKLIIDTVATFSVLIPDLLKDLNVKDYLDMDLIQQNKLTKVYLDQYFPWYKEWLTILANPDQFKTDAK